MSTHLFQIAGHLRLHIASDNTARIRTIARLLGVVSKLQRAPYSSEANGKLPDIEIRFNRRSNTVLEVPRDPAEPLRLICPKNRCRYPLLRPLLQIASLRHGYLALHATAAATQMDARVFFGPAGSGKTESLLRAMVDGARHVASETVFVDAHTASIRGEREPIRIRPRHLAAAPGIDAMLRENDRRRLQRWTAWQAIVRRTSAHLPPFIHQAGPTGRLLSRLDRRAAIDIEVDTFSHLNGTCSRSLFLELLAERHSIDAAGGESTGRTGDRSNSQCRALSGAEAVEPIERLMAAEARPVLNVARGAGAAALPDDITVRRRKLLSTLLQQPSVVVTMASHGLGEATMDSSHKPTENSKCFVSR